MQSTTPNLVVPFMALAAVPKRLYTASYAAPSPLQSTAHVPLPRKTSFIWLRLYVDRKCIGGAKASREGREEGGTKKDDEKKGLERRRRRDGGNAALRKKNPEGIEQALRRVWSNHVSIVLSGNVMLSGEGATMRNMRSLMGGVRK